MRVGADVKLTHLLRVYWLCLIVCESLALMDLLIGDGAGLPRDRLIAMSREV